MILQALPTSVIQVYCMPGSVRAGVCGTTLSAAAAVLDDSDDENVK